MTLRKTIQLVTIGAALLSPQATASQLEPPFEPVAVISGIAQVVDGDGIAFGGVEIRLQGIAAPEFGSRSRDPGGLEATRYLRTLASDKTVTCALDGTLAGKRAVGVCYVGTVELNDAMVRAGHARDCPRYSRGRYADAEAAARAAGNDLSAIYKLPKYCKR